MCLFTHSIHYTTDLQSLYLGVCSGAEDSVKDLDLHLIVWQTDRQRVGKAGYRDQGT